MDIGLFGQYVMNGLMLGMMYALVAVGFTLFFGVMDTRNFGVVLRVREPFFGLPLPRHLILLRGQLTAPFLLGFSNLLDHFILWFRRN